MNQVRSRLEELNRYIRSMMWGLMVMHLLTSAIFPRGLFGVVEGALAFQQHFREYHAGADSGRMKSFFYEHYVKTGAAHKDSAHQKLPFHQWVKPTQLSEPVDAVSYFSSFENIQKKEKAIPNTGKDAQHHPSESYRPPAV